VNQAAAHMHHEESKNPKDEQDYRDRPKHDGIPARSELHPARQTVSSAWRAATRPGVMVPHAQHDGNLYACNVREARGGAFRVLKAVFAYLLSPLAFTKHLRQTGRFEAQHHNERVHLYRFCRRT
jgi:hypothetical protein